MQVSARFNMRAHLRPQVRGFASATRACNICMKHAIWQCCQRNSFHASLCSRAICIGKPLPYIPANSKVHRELIMRSHTHALATACVACKSPVVLVYTAKLLSLLTDSSLWPSGENCSCVTVRPWPLRLPTAVHLTVSQSQMAAVRLVCALHAEATRSPDGEAARQKSSTPWPYSLATSGQRLLCARCSSKGAPANPPLHVNSLTSSLLSVAMLGL